MKMIVQRVTSASVAVEGKIIGEIDKGYLLLLGIGQEDTKEIAEKMTEKLFKLRIFEDENGKTNLSAADTGAEILVVSQFTLYASCRKGNRPSFTDAANPALAEELYEYVVSLCKGMFSKTQCGSFGADMKVYLVNDGPFTVVLDSKEIL